MRFRDRQERERYMDSLEQQMEHQRQEIQRTLDQTKGSGRLRTALEKLQNTFPSFPARASTRDVGERGAAPERTWWWRMFGG